MAQRIPGLGASSGRDRWWDPSGYSLDRPRRSPRVLELAFLVAALAVLAMAVQAFPVRAGTGPGEPGTVTAVGRDRADADDLGVAAAQVRGRTAERDDGLAALAAAAAVISLGSFAGASVIAVVPWSRSRRRA